MFNNLKKVFKMWNEMGEPEEYNRGEFNYGYKKVTELLFDGHDGALVSFMVFGPALIPIIGMIVSPIALAINYFFDDPFNVGEACLRLIIPTVVINIISTTIFWWFKWLT